MSKNTEIVFLTVLATAVLVVFKAFETITWPWIFVFTPIWILLFLVGFMYLFVFLLAKALHDE